MGFQISALNIDQFSHLFGQDRETLAKQGVQRIVVDANPVSVKSCDFRSGIGKSGQTE
jgi:hypothetical protein